jgi:hypothetical protein
MFNEDQRGSEPEVYGWGAAAHFSQKTREMGHPACTVICDFDVDSVAGRSARPTPAHPT